MHFKININRHQLYRLDFMKSITKLLYNFQFNRDQGSMPIIKYNIINGEA